jgi:hypothetical protein
MFSRLKDSLESGRDVLRDRYGDAESRLLDGLHHASEELSRRRDRGLELARGFSSRALATGEQASRSLTTIVRERPAESVLLVATVAFAAGWLVKHLRKSREEVVAKPAATRPRRKTTK